MNEVERREVKRSSSTTQFQKKDLRSQHQHQENAMNMASLRYLDGLVKHSSPPMLSYNQSLQSLSSPPKADEHYSKHSKAFQVIDQNIQNNHGLSGLHLHTPSMDKELKNLTQKLAIERTEIESELKKTQQEAVKWREKYEQILKTQQKQTLNGQNGRNIPYQQYNENILKSNSDLSGIQHKNFNDSTNSLMSALVNTTKSQVSEKDVKLLAQKFALERVGLENEIKNLQNERFDLENEVEVNRIENQNLKYMCEEIERQKDQEISDFKRKLQENEIELKKNIQQEFIKLGDNFSKEKTALEHKNLKYDEELDWLKRENQTLIDTIHQLNVKTKSQNDLIQNLTNSKQEQSLLFDKVSQLEKELQYITDQLLREQENKQGLLDKVTLEKNKSDILTLQLEEQRKNFDKLNSSSKEINNRFQDILKQLKFEQQRCETFEFDNESLQYQLNELRVMKVPAQYEGDYKLKYEDEKERNIDLLEQVDQQRQLIAQMKEQIDILDEFSKKITLNAEINQTNNDVQKSEYQRQIQYLSDALKSLQSKLALKLRILKKTYKLILCDAHLKSKLTEAQEDLKTYQVRITGLEDSLFSKQKELGDTQGRLGVCEMELNNKKKELLEKQTYVLSLEEKVREKQLGETNQYEISSLKLQIQRFQMRINEQDEDNQQLSEQNNLTEQLLQKMREQLSVKELEVVNIQQQLNELKFQQSYQEDLQMYQKKIDELRKVNEQNKNKMGDLLKLIEEKDKSIQELQLEYRIKIEGGICTEDFPSRKIDTEKSDAINIRNLETVYEQRITQLYQNKTAEVERYINTIHTQNQELQRLSEKNDDYLSKMDILSTELEKLQTIINSKELQISVLSQEINQLKISSLQVVNSHSISDVYKQNEFDTRLSKTQNIQFNQFNDSTQASSQNLMQSQLQSLKIELQQTKQTMEDKIKQGEVEISQQRRTISLINEELDAKNEEIRKLFQAQSQQLTASFSKDSTIKQCKEEIKSLNIRICELEVEKREVQQKYMNGANKQEVNQQVQNTEQYIQQINQYGQIISQQKEQIEELTQKNQMYLHESSSFKDSRNFKNLTDFELNKSISNSLANFEYDVQVSKLKREVQQLTKLCESQESSLKILQNDTSALRKELEETKEKYKNSEQTLNNLKGHIVNITQDNEKLVNRIKDLQYVNSNQNSRKNSLATLPHLPVQTESSIENYMRETDRQKQSFMQQIADLTQRIEKCQFDKLLLSQEVERLRDGLKQKEKQIDVFKQELKTNSQTELQQSIKNLTMNFSNEKHCLEEKIKILETQNSMLKCEQSVIVDETMIEHQKNIEWEKEIRKNVEDEIKQLVQKYLQQKCLYERIIAELKVQLGTLQKQFEEQKEILQRGEDQYLTTLQSENLTRMMQIKNSENKSLQIRLESTEKQKNEEVKKLKQEIQRIHEENLSHSKFEVYAERIGYQSAIMESEQRIKELEGQIRILEGQLEASKSKKIDCSLEFMQQIQSRNAWQIEVSKLIEELKVENKQLHQSVFDQEQTIVKLQLQNTSLIIQDSYYILSK